MAGRATVHLGALPMAKIALDWQEARRARHHDQSPGLLRTASRCRRFVVTNRWNVENVRQVAGPDPAMRTRLGTRSPLASRRYRPLASYRVTRSPKPTASGFVIHRGR